MTISKKMKYTRPLLRNFSEKVMPWCKDGSGASDTGDNYYACGTGNTLGDDGTCSVGDGQGTTRYGLCKDGFQDSYDATWFNSGYFGCWSGSTISGTGCHGGSGAQGAATTNCGTGNGASS